MTEKSPGFRARLAGKVRALARRVTRGVRATAEQRAGAAAIAVGVGLLAGFAWALVAAGVAMVVFGIATEVS